MPKIFASRFRKGKKPQKDVPAKLRAEVKALLDGEVG